jgi:hypothetical protein
MAAGQAVVSAHGQDGGQTHKFPRRTPGLQVSQGGIPGYDAPLAANFPAYFGQCGEWVRQLAAEPLVCAGG